MHAHDEPLEVTVELMKQDVRHLATDVQISTLSHALQEQRNGERVGAVTQQRRVLRFHLEPQRNAVDLRRDANSAVRIESPGWCRGGPATHCARVGWSTQQKRANVVPAGRSTP